MPDRLFAVAQQVEDLDSMRLGQDSECRHAHTR
jgi:hypothetical protein